MLEIESGRKEEISVSSHSRQPQVITGGYWQPQVMVGPAPNTGL